MLDLVESTIQYLMDVTYVQDDSACQDQVHTQIFKKSSQSAWILKEKFTLRADCGSCTGMKLMIIFEQKNAGAYWIY